MKKIKQANGTIPIKKVATHFFRDNTRRISRLGSMPDTSPVNRSITYETPFPKKFQISVLMVSCYRAKS
jgi:hypothetical protein